MNPLRIPKRVFQGWKCTKGMCSDRNLPKAEMLSKSLCIMSHLLPCKRLDRRTTGSPIATMVIIHKLEDVTERVQPRMDHRMVKTHASVHD